MIRRSVPPRARAKKKSASTITLSATGDFVEWMQDEYLSEITIADLAPSPVGGSAPEVGFTFWLHGVGNGKRVPYRVRARGVTTWRLDGEVGDDAVSLAAGDATVGVHLVMNVPGRLELACDTVEISRGRPVGVVARRPFTDYAYFTARGARVVSFADVLSALGAPPGATVTVGGASVPEERMRARLESLPIGKIGIMVGGAPWVELFWMLPPGDVGYSMSVARGPLLDEAWHRVQELPARLAATEVASAWEFQGSAAEWARAVDLAPPPDSGA